MKTEIFLPQNLTTACEKHWRSNRRTDRMHELLACLNAETSDEAAALLDVLKRSEDKDECNEAARALRALAADAVAALQSAAGSADLLAAVGADVSALRDSLRESLLLADYVRDRVAAPWVDQADIAAAVAATGVQKGDILLVHASYSKLGHVIGGAQAVVDALRAVIGDHGTLVMPTLSQTNFEHAYEAWRMDRPSDVGYLSEYFRKLPGVLRSDQATHSVAAIGQFAHELTKEHCAYGPRLCLFGPYAFGHSSPWQKMYDIGGKVLFLGASARTNTFKHFIECCLVERRIDAVKDPALRQALIDGLWRYEDYEKVVAGDTSKAWPMYAALPVTAVLDEEGFVAHGSVGDAELLCMDIQTMVRETTRVLESDLARWYPENAVAWFEKADAFADK